MTSPGCRVDDVDVDDDDDDEKEEDEDESIDSQTYDDELVCTELMLLTCCLCRVWVS